MIEYDPLTIMAQEISPMELSNSKSNDDMLDPAAVIASLHSEFGNEMDLMPLFTSSNSDQDLNSAALAALINENNEEIVASNNNEEDNYVDPWGAIDMMLLDEQNFEADVEGSNIDDFETEPVKPKPGTMRKPIGKRPLKSRLKNGINFTKTGERKLLSDSSSRTDVQDRIHIEALAAAARTAAAALAAQDHINAVKSRTRSLSESDHFSSFEPFADNRPTNNYCTDVLNGPPIKKSTSAAMFHSPRFEIGTTSIDSNSKQHLRSSSRNSKSRNVTTPRSDIDDEDSINQKSIKARGAYKCGLCGKPKVNHVCELKEGLTIVSSRTVQANPSEPILSDPVNMIPIAGEKILTVNSAGKSINKYEEEMSVVVEEDSNDLSSVYYAQISADGRAKPISKNRSRSNLPSASSHHSGCSKALFCQLSTVHEESNDRSDTLNVACKKFFCL